MTGTRGVRVGDIEVIPIVDTEGTFDTFRGVFPGATPEQEAFARDRYGELFRGDDWWLPFRCFLLRLADAAVLVDAGVAHQRRFLPDAEARLLDRLGEEGVAVEDVDVVLLTHLHVDHVGWTVDEGELVFPRARYVASAADVDYFLGERRESPSVVEKVAPLARHGALQRLPLREHDLAPGVTVFPTPGHTPGHLALRVRSDGAELLLLGDTFVHPLQLLDPGLVYESDVDPALAARTRGELVELIDRTTPLVAAAHFPCSGIGSVTTTAAGRVFEPRR